MHLVYLPGCSAPKGPDAEKFKILMDHKFRARPWKPCAKARARANIYVTDTLPRRAGEMDLRIDTTPSQLYFLHRLQRGAAHGVAAILGA